MNILLVDHNYPKDTPFLLNKYRELNKRNTVSLLHWGKVMPNGVIRNRSNGSTTLQLIFGFCKLLLFHPFKTSGLLVKGYRIMGKKIVTKMIRDNAFFSETVDLIHFEFGTLAVDRMYLKQLLDCNIIVSFRGYDLNYYKLNTPTIYNEVWKHADGFHFLGNDLLNRAIRRGYPNNKPNFLISPAIDVSLFTPEPKLPYTEGTIQIVSTGRLVWKKGYEYALLAIRKLIDQGYSVQYTIIGDGPLRNALLLNIHQHNLQNNVLLVGKQSQQYIKSYLQQSHIFLHPAVSEGFCNAVIEAQAMGLPVVTTHADGLPENIEENITGLVAPIYDADGLAHKLSLLINDPNKMQQFAQNGQKRVQAKFQLEQQIQLLQKMYHTFETPITV